MSAASPGAHANLQPQHREQKQQQQPQQPQQRHSYGEVALHVVYWPDGADPTSTLPTKMKLKVTLSTVATHVDDLYAAIKAQHRDLPESSYARLVFKGRLLDRIDSLDEIFSGFNGIPPVIAIAERRDRSSGNPEAASGAPTAPTISGKKGDSSHMADMDLPSSIREAQEAQKRLEEMGVPKMRAGRRTEMEARVRLAEIKKEMAADLAEHDATLFRMLRAPREAYVRAQQRMTPLAVTYEPGWTDAEFAHRAGLEDGRRETHGLSVYTREEVAVLANRDRRMMRDQEEAYLNRLVRQWMADDDRIWWQQTPPEFGLVLPGEEALRNEVFGRPVHPAAFEPVTKEDRDNTQEQKQRIVMLMRLIRQAIQEKVLVRSRPNSEHLVSRLVYNPSVTREQKNRASQQRQEPTTMQQQQPGQEQERTLKKEQKQEQKQEHNHNSRAEASAEASRKPPARNPPSAAAPVDPNQLSVRELKAALDARRVTYGDCIEKIDLVNRYEKTMQLDPIPPAPTRAPPASTPKKASKTHVVSESSSAPGKAQQSPPSQAPLPPPKTPSAKAPTSTKQGSQGRGELFDAFMKGVHSAGRSKK